MNLSALERRAEELVAVPFETRGRDPTSGLDCMGLVWELWRAAGVEDVPDEVEAERLPGLLERWGESLREVDQAFPGAMFVIEAQGDRVDHVGVVSASGEFIQLTASHGMIRLSPQRTLRLIRGKVRFYVPRRPSH